MTWIRLFLAVSAVWALGLGVACSSGSSEGDDAGDTVLDERGFAATSIEGAYVIRSTAEASGLPAGSDLAEIEFVDAGPECVVQASLGGRASGEVACATGLASTELSMQFPRAVLTAPGCDEPTWRVEIVLLELSPTGDDTDHFEGDLSFVSDLLRDCEGLSVEPGSLQEPATFTDNPVPVELVPA